MQTTIVSNKVALFTSAGMGPTAQEVVIKQPGGAVNFYSSELNSLIALLTLVARNPGQDISMTLGNMGLDPKNKHKDKDRD